MEHERIAGEPAEVRGHSILLCRCGWKTAPFQFYRAGNAEFDRHAWDEDLKGEGK